jgi:hypothetical protein
LKSPEGLENTENTFLRGWLIQLHVFKRQKWNLVIFHGYCWQLKVGVPPQEATNEDTACRIAEFRQ